MPTRHILSVVILLMKDLAQILVLL